jgi:hypothetical protein
MAKIAERCRRTLFFAAEPDLPIATVAARRLPSSQRLKTAEGLAEYLIFLGLLRIWEPEIGFNWRRFRAVQTGELSP